MVYRQKVGRGGVGQNITQMPKTASTAFTENSFVVLSSGKLIPATGSTKIDGVILQRVTSADADYASVVDKQVDRPVSRDHRFVVAIDDTSGIVPGVQKELKTATEVEGGTVTGTASVIIEEVIKTGTPGLVAVSIIK